MFLIPHKLPTVLRILAFAAGIAVLCTSSTISSAAIHTIDAHPGGGLLRFDNSADTFATAPGGAGDGTRLIGTSSTPDDGLSNVLFFELPSLGVGESISDATLSFDLDRIDGNPVFNTDLYGLGFVGGPPSLVGSWFFEGPVTDSRSRDDLDTPDGSALSVSLIEDNILTGASTPGIVSTTASASLVSFLNSLYADGATGGDFAVFHFAADLQVSGNTQPASTGYRIIHSAVAAGDEIGELQITTIPEPTSCLIGIALAGMAIVFRWRQERIRRAT